LKPGCLNDWHALRKKEPRRYTYTASVLFKNTAASARGRIRIEIDPDNKHTESGKEAAGNNSMTLMLAEQGPAFTRPEDRI
jgi:hypothetical protein